MIIEVKDYHLNSYQLDAKKNWQLKSKNTSIKSPISQVNKYKENLFNLHIEKLLEQKILDIRSFNFVTCALYFHNATQIEIQNFLVNPFKEDKKYQDFLKYNILLFGKDDLVQDKFFYNLKSTDFYKEKTFSYFTSEIYNSFKRFLNPPFHYKESITHTIVYSKKQLELIYAGESKKEQRIRGVVGSGKTTVLAARAVQAVKRTNSRILILTYNITLKNYIKDKISAVREDFDWTNFIILNYHHFINSELNNIGIDVSVPDNFNQYPDENKHKYFEDNFYSNQNLFLANKDNLTKYDAIFIDEIQDYSRAWMDIIKKCFLKENAEYVLFGDVKQNIYNKTTSNKDVSTNVRGVTDLKKSFRASLKMQELTLAFQNEFFSDKYDIDNKEEFFKKKGADLSLDFESDGQIKYMYLSDIDSVSSLYTIIYQNSLNKGIQPNDLVVLGTTIHTLREFDSYYRYSCNEKTNVMFETNEVIYRIGLNFSTELEFKWIKDLRILLKCENDKIKTRGNNLISILMTLYDLFLKYPYQFKDKLDIICTKHKISSQAFLDLCNVNSSGINYFKTKYNHKTLKSNIKLVRENKKIHFFMNSGTMKISTVHSFKGWESENIFLIIDKTPSLTVQELIYTGLTRCKTNLFIINYGNIEYDSRLRELVSNAEKL